MKARFLKAHFSPLIRILRNCWLELTKISFCHYTFEQKELSKKEKEEYVELYKEIKKESNTSEATEKILSAILTMVCLCNFCTSCNTENASSVYEINLGEEMKIPLLYWDLCGPLSNTEDSMTINAIIDNPSEMFHFQMEESEKKAFVNSTYIPKYGQLDLKEVFDMDVEDTTRIYSDKLMLMKCMLNTDKDSTLYLEVKTSMPSSFWINGDSLKRIDIQGLNIYKLPLNAGSNTVLVKSAMDSYDLSFEATVYNSNSIARLYTEGQSGNIIYPLISRQTKTVTLTNNHQNVIDGRASLSFYDSYGNLVNSQYLCKDSMKYVVPELEPDKSYTCKLQVGKHVITQSVCCGNGDDSYVRFCSMMNELPEGHHRIDEISQILYRLKFLLEHPTRYDGDWWWQFKIAPLTYQLEYIFSHLNASYGTDCNEPNVKFMTYKSNLDDGTQRYILVTPNDMEPQRAYPLVVVIRPNIENHRHFFTCPQIARQWAVNQMQALANRYGYIVMIPEMRTYLSENLTPMAEAELKLAIQNVKEQYRIDKNRIYLHANCSGGYRALSLATQNPNMFAAMGLYAPVYDMESNNLWTLKRTPKQMLKKLKGTQIMVHYDPLDKHSPYKMFKDLITDCDKFDIPLTVSVKRNSGVYYNVVLAGEEAFEFFKDKKRNKDAESKCGSDTRENRVIADLYSKPFVYVYNSDDHSELYKNLLDSIKTEYEAYHYPKLPLLADSLLTKNHILCKNIMLIGATFKSKIAARLIQDINYVPTRYSKGHGAVEMKVHSNPYDESKVIVTYNSEPARYFKHKFKKAWTLTQPYTTNPFDYGGYYDMR